MDAKLTQYQTFRDFINKMLFWCGIWPHLKDFRFYYRILTFMAILMSFSFGTKVFSFGLSNASTVSILVQSLSAAFGQYTLLLKVVSFLLYRKDLILLDNELGRTFEEKLKSENNRPFLLQGISVYGSFLYGTSGLLALVTFVFYNGPIIHALRDKKYEYIYRGTYPVVPGSSLYWILLFCEAASVWFTFNLTNGVDSAFGLHCFRACGLLRLAAQRWKQLQPNDPKYKDEIRKYVQMHQLVIRSKDSLQRVFGFIVLWNYVVISLILCSLLWQANQVMRHMTLFRNIYFICYIMVKSLQAFTYAYYGSLVSRESENYQEAVYFSDWPGSGNVRLMKDILIVNAQRIIALKASGYFYITMEMFEKIVKTSLSYFFLMQTIESKS